MPSYLFLDPSPKHLANIALVVAPNPTVAYQLSPVRGGAVTIKEVDLPSEGVLASMQSGLGAVDVSILSWSSTVDELIPLDDMMRSMGLLGAVEDVVPILTHMMEGQPNHRVKAAGSILLRLAEKMINVGS